jgi:hypothetical protein
VRLAKALSQPEIEQREHDDGERDGHPILEMNPENAKLADEPMSDPIPHRTYPPVKSSPTMKSPQRRPIVLKSYFIDIFP